MLLLVLGCWLFLRAIIAAGAPSLPGSAVGRVALAMVSLLLVALLLRRLLPVLPSPFDWLDVRGLGLWLPPALVAGFALMSSVFGALLLAQWYEFIRVDAAASELLRHVAVWLLVAGFEELLFRGILLRGLEVAIGSIPAVVASSLLFGVAHVDGGAVDAWGAIAIAAGGGALFGAAAVTTRSLWPAIGLHAGWNFAQSAVFGLPAPSLELGPGLTIGSVTGPAAVAGTTASVETGALAVAVAALAAVAILVAGRRQLVPVRGARRSSRAAATSMPSMIDQPAEDRCADRS